MRKLLEKWAVEHTQPGGLKNKTGVRTSKKSIDPGRVRTVFSKFYLRPWKSIPEEGWG